MLYYYTIHCLEICKRVYCVIWCSIKYELPPYLHVNPVSPTRLLHSAHLFGRTAAGGSTAVITGEGDGSGKDSDSDADSDSNSMEVFSTGISALEIWRCFLELR